MQKKVKLIIGILSLLISNVVYSCDCIDSLSFQDLFNKADVVFIGKIEEIYLSTNIKRNDTRLSFSNILAEKIYKGDNRVVENTVTSIFNFNSSCDYVFKKGETYIIFGCLKKDNIFILTSKCSGNKLKEELTDEELTFLNKYLSNIKDEDVIKIE